MNVLLDSKPRYDSLRFLVWKTPSPDLPLDTEPPAVELVVVVVDRVGEAKPTTRHQSSAALRSPSPPHGIPGRGVKQEAMALHHGEEGRQEQW